MNDQIEFRPPRQTGMLFQLTVIAILVAVFSLSMAQALQTQLGSSFFILLGISIIVFVPVPILMYRVYALWRAIYTLERDGVHLRWGLRFEDIPLTEILWVCPTSELGFHLSPPLLSWPGSIQGSRHVKELGIVEFMASSYDMVLIATERRVFAISPQDPVTFVRAFQNAAELGSLSPMQASSIYPTFVFGRIWQNPIARNLLLSALVLNVFLLVWVGSIVSNRNTISLGFTANGVPLELGPATSLLLLPILSAFFYAVDLIAGTYFYRVEEHRPIAYILWGCSILSPILLFMGAFFTSQV
jgi:hypothetical protein